MSIRQPLLTRLLTGAALLACITALPVQAQSADPGGPDSAAFKAEVGALHGFGDIGAGAIATLAPSTSPDGAVVAPVAAGASAVDIAVAVGPVTAADVAQDSATTAGGCDAYFAQSRAVAPLVEPAFKAMAAHDAAGLETQMPALQAAFDALPSEEIKPEACGGTHINAYTRPQFLELAVLRAHGVDTGFPAGLPLVKQPELAQGPLAFVIGWTKYGEKDYGGALAVFGKGLTLFPHDHNLQHEYMATLLAQKQGAQAIAFVDSVLSGTYDLDDRERASFLEGRAIGLILLHAADAADSDFSAAQKYFFTAEVKSLQDSLHAARAAAQANAPVVK